MVIAVAYLGAWAIFELHLFSIGIVSSTDCSTYSRSAIMNEGLPNSVETKGTSAISHGELFQSLDHPDDSIDLHFSVEKRLACVDVDSILSTSRPPLLPDFDRGETTKLLCICTLVVTWLIILVRATLGILSIFIVPTSSFLYPIQSSLKGGAALSFLMSALVALITNALVYIHGTSLRGDLFREGRLEYNTNLRLFTSTPKHAPNRWPANVVSILSLIMCYAASSQLFLILLEEEYIDHVFVNSITLLGLALGLLAKTSIATWIMHRSNKCMLSRNGFSIASKSMKPLLSQHSIRASNKSVGYVLGCLWTFSSIRLLWFIVLVPLSKHYFEEELFNGPWNFTLSWRDDDDHHMSSDAPWIALSESDSVSTPWAVALLLGILILAIAQELQTLGLHAAELAVNISRDESTWRAASSYAMGEYRALCIQSRLTLDIRANYSNEEGPGEEFHIYGFKMLYSRVFVYCIVTTGLAGFTTFIAYRNPRDPRPAAFGHYHTLADFDRQLDS
ncbi:uncharacterized protein PAC_04620 [Phialocephala subalpina]|uniref:Uncharacterized protein n=1 Tax=Phialocephala subalpina TaxID=576137 RepID=A0A1L7WPP2_9HELO|nr:uncharacterized protein PAC_04620 [Phialocephala subalpina]